MRHVPVQENLVSQSTNPPIRHVRLPTRVLKLTMEEIGRSTWLADVIKDTDGWLGIRSITRLQNDTLHPPHMCLYRLYPCEK